ncbi:hypothetical protein GCM10007332_02630 [Epilithonimonas arachidiradicis]|uniref:Uncharacterized protein n=1 Tax=Epilithonimonas arachidiradicis TaxID=1617282 RepID=A0ABQ1WT27_9FLAO|nr:hypothetical protein GCM10007332_02630 [Epilithonimonas arachidiradicis]
MTSLILWFHFNDVSLSGVEDFLELEFLFQATICHYFFDGLFFEKRWIDGEAATGIVVEILLLF